LIPTPPFAKSIEKDIDAARTHLNSHVTTKEEILALDKIVNIVRFILKKRNIST
jgi:hypothetical protein